MGLSESKNPENEEKEESSARIASKKNRLKETRSKNRSTKGSTSQSIITQQQQQSISKNKTKLLTTKSKYNSITSSGPVTKDANMMMNSAFIASAVMGSCMGSKVYFEPELPEGYEISDEKYQDQPPPLPPPFLPTNANEIAFFSANTPSLKPRSLIEPDAKLAESKGQGMAGVAIWTNKSKHMDSKFIVSTRSEERSDDDVLQAKGITNCS